MIIKYKGDLCPINQKYLSRRFVLSKRYRECKESIAWSIKKGAQGNLERLTGNVSIKLITFYPRQHDVDCFIKVILDSMNGLVFDDDKQVVKIEVVKRKSKCIGFVAKLSADRG